MIDKSQISDGYHTFEQLYHQRAVLFAVIVNQYSELAWKSWKYADGDYCSDNKDYFLVGIDTPEGSYTYHVHEKYWDMYDCRELEYGRPWDGHTEKDVIRLLSLNAKTKSGSWVEHNGKWYCSTCGYKSDTDWLYPDYNFCPNCGVKILED